MSGMGLKSGSFVGLRLSPYLGCNYRTTSE